ncbi:MAG TPA: hypothetical protein VJX95_04225 [Oscillospiraceae bacterium]|nr:hypothetical protein [Oscillospiraceae bacterium]
MTKKESEKRFMRTNLPIISALVLIVGAVGYILLRYLSERAYNEKWKDYYDCGI